MSYKTENIKEGINIHYIKTDKFKTNIITIFLTVPLNKSTVTSNALIPAVLRRGTNNLKTQDEISKKLEEMYGATFDCGIEKTGDNQVLKFYLEMVNDNYLPRQEDNLKDGINMLSDIVFNPLLENGKFFKEEYVNSEKENLKKIIEAKIDNKDRYAYERCIEEMYKGKTYGIYKYGYIEDLEKINCENLYEDYVRLIETSRIDIFVSGDINEKEVIDIVNNNENINKLESRKDPHIVNSKEDINKIQEPTLVEEKINVTQGKLVIGTNIDFNEEDIQYKISVYNVILGEGATSKMFQNVREKEGLAYSARSNYVRQKQNIFIRCGIKINNFEKALEVIKKQLQDMKEGNFSEEDINDSKNYIISSLNNIDEEQDSQISYYFGQELSDEFISPSKYEEKIKQVSRKDIQNVANSLKINTIYFLKN